MSEGAPVGEQGSVDGGKLAAVRSRIVALVTASAEGDRLPSERDLAVEWGVARMTLRRVLDELVTEGWSSASRVAARSWHARGWRATSP